MAAATTFIEIAGDTSKYERSMREVERHTEKASNFIKKSWLEIAAATYTAMKAWDAMKLGARAQQEEQAFRNMAASYGANADEIIADLKRTSAGTVDTMTLIEKAGTAMMMGIAPEKVSRLMEIARATARMTGQDVTKAFEDISLAVGRQSRMILDNLGIIVKVEEANKRYAAELGKSSTELTETEKKQAFLNATLLAGEDMMRRLGDQTKTTAEMFQSLEAFVENVKVAMGKGLIVAIRYTVMAFAQAGAVINQTLEQITEGWGYIFELLGQLPGGELLGFKALGEKLSGLADHFREARMAANQFTMELLDMDEQTKTMPRIMVTGEREEAGGVDKDMQRAEEQAAMEMAKAQETLLQKSEMEKFFEEELTEYLYTMRQARLEEQTGFAQQSIELRQWEHDAALQIAQMQAEEEMRLEAEKQKKRSQGIRQMLQDYQIMFKQLGQQNKAAFIAFKAFAIAETIIDTIKAAQAAFAWGMSVGGPYAPALAAAAAAAAAMAGMARVAQIASTEPGEGAGAVAGEGGAVGTYAASPITGLPEYSTQAEQRGTVQIIIQGDSINDEEYLERWAEKVSELVEKKDVRLVASSSRFADQLT